MCDNLHLDSIQQCETPLNTLFFSEFNVNLLQRGIRQTFKNKTDIAIDYQNTDDLYGIIEWYSLTIPVIITIMLMDRSKS